MATHNLYVWLTSFISISQLIFTLAQSDNYIVYMDLSAMPKAFSSQHSWYSATLQSASATVTKATAPTDIPSTCKLIYSYKHVMNGFSASLTPAELAILKTSPGYVSSVRDLPVEPDTTHSPQFLGLNYKSGAWPASKFGQDVIIGVVDTGVWPESESFNDKGMTEVPSKWKGKCEVGTQFNSSMCNKKLIGARFFNKGLIAQTPGLNISMNSARDTSGHGTHTSGTAAGNYVQGASYLGYARGTAVGVAPRARVAIYKALWNEGSLSSDIIAAIDQAIVDGVDVLSISLGRHSDKLYEDPIAIATFAAMEKNIFVSTSAGNRGPDILSLHNGIPWVLTVAAGTVDRDFRAALTLANGVQVTGMSRYAGNSSLSHVEIVFMNECLNQTELNNIGQKIVVCQDNKTDSIIGNQVGNLQDANVSGGVFITNLNRHDLELYLRRPYPTVFVSFEDGEIIKAYINKNSSPKASMKMKITALGTKPAPSLASYSSRGPSRSCPFVLKPDIMAPGDLILAAWLPHKNVEHDPLSFSNFNLLSGTSMACPHAAGIAALLKGVHPEWSPAAIRSAIMTTSDSNDNTNSHIKDIGDNNERATPLAMGAGHINPNKALDPGLIYDAATEDYVNLLCALNYNMKQIKTITKSSFNNCSTPSTNLNYPSFIAFFNENEAKQGSRTVKEFRRTMTNVGQGKSTYIANMSSVKGFNISVVPNKLIFRGKNDKRSFKLIIEGPSRMEELISFGYLNWVEIGGKHVVKSPVTMTRIFF